MVILNRPAAFDLDRIRLTAGLAHDSGKQADVLINAKSLKVTTPEMSDELKPPAIDQRRLDNLGVLERFSPGLSLASL
jgi:hypothetical protein